MTGLPCDGGRTMSEDSSKPGGGGTDTRARRPVSYLPEALRALPQSLDAEKGVLGSILLAACLFALAGCTTPPSGHAGAGPEIRKTTPVKTIRITSVPAGCIVELNGEYIGQTPFSLTVDADLNGCWPCYYQSGGIRSFSNRFVCTAPNGCTDNRYWSAGDRIPDVVLFRPFGRYPGQQPLQLGMNTGS